MGRRTILIYIVWFHARPWYRWSGFQSCEQKKSPLKEIIGKHDIICLLPVLGVMSSRAASDAEQIQSIDDTQCMSSNSQKPTVYSLISIFILLSINGTFLSADMLSDTFSSDSLCIAESPKSCSHSDRKTKASRWKREWTSPTLQYHGRLNVNIEETKILSSTK